MQLVFDATVGQIPKYTKSFVYCNECEMMNECQVKNKTEVSSQCDKDRRSKRRNSDHIKGCRTHKYQICVHSASASSLEDTLPQKQFSTWFAPTFNRISF